MAYDATNNLNDLDESRPVGSTELGSILDEVDRETRRTLKAVILVSHDSLGNLKANIVTTNAINAAAVTGAKIAADAVDRTHINPNVAGVALKQNANGSLEVDFDNATLVLTGNTLKVGTIPGTAITAQTLPVNALASSVASAIPMYNATSGAWTFVTLSGDISTSETGVATISSNATIPLSCAMIIETATAGITSGGWVDRVLNNAVNPNSFLTLQNPGFRLSQGTYAILASVPGYVVDRHQAKLINSTTAADLLFGSAAIAPAGVQTESVIRGTFVVTDQSHLHIIQHQVQTTNAVNGFGVASGFAGTQVVLANVFLVKIA